MKSITAKDFMVTRLVTLKPEMDVHAAVNLLLKNRISGAPVVDAQHTFMGVFSEKCSMHVILDAAYEQLPTNEVRAFMDTEAKTIRPDTDLLSIAQVFLLTNYRRLPVVEEDGQLVGQVSRRDVLRAAMKEIDFKPARENSFLYISALMDSHDAPIS